MALVGLAGCAAPLGTSSTEPGAGDPGALEDVAAAVPPASIELERACAGGDASACARVAELFEVADGALWRTSVHPRALEAGRIAGEANIVPDDDTKNLIASSGHGKVVGSFKLCLTAGGDVATIETVLSTGFPGYDRVLTHGLYRWRYRPFMVDGVPTPVCTAVTFIYSQHQRRSMCGARCRG